MDLLDDLDEVDLQVLAPMARQHVIPRRRYVYLPDDPSDSLYVLVSGKVRVAKLSRDGKEITLAILCGGDLFGEQAILGAARRGTMTEVIEEATLCEIAREDFEAFVSQRPAVAYRLVRLMAARQQEIQERIEELAFRDVPTRLARLLTRLVDCHGHSVADGTVIDLPLTHQEVANLIGATRETTTATLNDFRRAGVLTLGRKRIVVTDRARLGSMAKMAVAVLQGDNGNGNRVSSRATATG
ncbi:MAG: Crp/Fnr family transcriptional regulator [Candidatus Eiseniibacteriota bacterium]